VTKKNNNNKVQTLPSGDLPENWILSTLGEISTKPQYGWTTKANHESGNVKLLRTTDITSGQINWATVPYCSKEPDDLDKYLLEPGDIVISRAGSVGVSYLLTNTDNAVFASYLIRFRPNEPVDKKYVYYYLKSPDYWKAIGKSTLGIAVPNVNATKLAKVKIPIAPENEQKRIVAEIEKQFSRLDEAVDNLKRVKANLKRYKASVLKAAVEGKLTEEWRKKHLDVEPADKLLERILAERRKKWEEAEWAKIKAKGKVPKDDKWKKKYKEPAKPNLNDLSELQDGWLWVNIDQIMLLLTDYHANGSYKVLKKHVTILDEDAYAIYIRATNLKKNKFDSDLKFVNKKAYDFVTIQRKKQKEVKKDLTGVF
jgi:type I restriction enzyme S subunit